SACATIGVWTMLHSSAFDDLHAIPTTSDITLAAHRNGSLGARVFPSQGLQLVQICEAIAASGFVPQIVNGDLRLDGASQGQFTREYFCGVVASLLRSGYPVLAVCDRAGGTIPHAVVLTGFRPAPPP